MSGIINSVGSKSGIIGSTEIPGGYEEGTFKSLYIGGSEEAGQADSYYVKIGRMVFLNLRGETNTADSSATISLKVPFTIATYIRGHRVLARIHTTWYDLYHYDDAGTSDINLYTDGNLSSAATSQSGNYCYMYGQFAYQTY